MRRKDEIQPDEAIVKIVLDSIQTFKEVMFQSGKQQDSIAVWLVGMSTGSIALIVSQFAKFDPNLLPSLKICIFFLAGTIVFGLLFRLWHLILQKKERDDLLYIFSWLSGFGQRSTTVPVELPEDWSEERIAWQLFHLMEMEVRPELIEFVQSQNNPNYWRKQYEEYAELCNREEVARKELIQATAEEISTFISCLEGESNRNHEPESKMTESRGTKKRRLRRFCTSFYVLMCISFAVAVILISWSFIRLDAKVSPRSATMSQETSAPAKSIPSSKIERLR